MGLPTLGSCLLVVLAVNAVDDSGPPVVNIQAVSPATMSPSTKATRLAVVTRDDRSVVQVWDLNSRTRIKTLDHPEIQNWTAVSYSDDSSDLVAGAADGRVVVWDATSGKVRCDLTDDDERPVELVRMARDRRALFIQYKNPSTCVLWDVQAEQRLASFEPRGEPRRIIFSRQGDWMTAVYSEGVWHWNADGDAGNASVQEQAVRVHHVALSPHAHRMAVVTDDGLEIWRTSSPERMPRPLRCMPHTRSRFVDEESLLVMRPTEDDINLETWHVPQNPEEMEFVSAQGGIVATDLAALSDGSRVAVIGDNPAFVTVHRRENAKPLLLGRDIHILRSVDPERNEGMEHAVCAIAFLDQGERLAAAHANGVVRVWPLLERSSPQQFESLPRPKHLWVSPNKTTLVVVDHDTAIQLVDLTATVDLAPRRRIGVTYRRPNDIDEQMAEIRAFDVSGDGRLAALSVDASDRETRLFDLMKFRWLGRIEEFGPWALRFSANGDWLFMVSQESFQLLDVRRAEQYKIEPRHDAAYQGGEPLVFCRWKGADGLLNPSSGDYTCHLKYQSLSDRSAYARAVSGDGKRMAVVADRKDDRGLGLEIFNTLDGKTLVSRPFNEKHLVAMAFHPHQPRSLVVVNPRQIRTYDYGRNEWTTVAELDRFEGYKQLEDSISDPFSGFHGMGRLLEGVPLENLGDNPVRCAAVSSQSIVAVGQLKSITLWSLDTGKLLVELPQTNEEVVKSMRFSANGKVLCYAPERGAFYAVDVSRLGNGAQGRRPHEVAKPIDK